MRYPLPSLGGNGCGLRKTRDNPSKTRPTAKAAKPETAKEGSRKAWPR